jgi:hypothetical protein
MLQTVQLANRIYNSDIDPEHEYDGYCSCMIHQYKRAKIRRLPVQNMWSKAVMYPVSSLLLLNDPKKRFLPKYQYTDAPIYRRCRGTLSG